MRNRYWTEEEKSIAINLLQNGKTYEEISVVLNRTICACRYFCSKKLKIKSQNRITKYSKNKFFWNIPNPINCYWAGMWAADGNVRQNIRNKNQIPYYSFTLELQKGDKHHLEKFTKDCLYTGKVIDKKPRIVCKKITHNCYVTITDKDWANPLKENFNIIPNKSKILQPPNLENLYLKLCYLIGYIDGDGYIGFQGDKLCLSICSGSKNILEWIREIILNNFNKRISTNQPPGKIHKTKENVFYYNLRTLQAAYTIDYLRQIPVPKLQRKWFNPRVNAKIEEYKLKYPEFFQKILPIT